MIVSGHIVDIANKQIFQGEVVIQDGRIGKVTRKPGASDRFIIPGFIDAHVHIESSMLVPSEFARLAVVHGTVATVSDPHEIANVLGIPGVDFMIENGNQVPFHFFFGAPSCVPATSFETAGARLDAPGVEELLKRTEIRYLAEMMNWPGVLNGDALVHSKIALARKYGKVVDGHAPGLMGEQAIKYMEAGITTDHECVTLAEALHKLKAGMKIIIREGSAARNFEALIDLLPDHEDTMMFCSDDKHPDSLEEGHINLLVKRAVAKGIDVYKVLKAACINPIHHYGLPVGQLRAGDSADFIVVDNLRDFNVESTYIKGMLVSENGKSMIGRVTSQIVNNFSVRAKIASDFKLAAGKGQARVIEALDGQLITKEILCTPRVVDGFVESDIDQDVLKIVVVNRYNDQAPAVALIRNFGLRKGAIASSVAHDSHNIIAVGVDDDSISRAVNKIIEVKGGVVAIHGNHELILPLPVAGLMSIHDGYEVARKYKDIDQMAKEMGSALGSPFMTLSFMALLVIPSLKLSDQGLFDGDAFEFRECFNADL